MAINDWQEKTEAPSSDRRERGSCSCDELKAILADKIHKVAEALRDKAAEQDAHSGAAHYRNEASEWLEQSAEYVREFDDRQADAKFREYVKQSPERSLLIAGAVGLVIGTLWRRH